MKRVAYLLIGIIMSLPLIGMAQSMEFISPTITFSAGGFQKYGCIGGWRSPGNMAFQMGYRYGNHSYPKGNIEWNSMIVGVNYTSPGVDINNSASIYLDVILDGITSCSNEMAGQSGMTINPEIGIMGNYHHLIWGAGIEAPDSRTWYIGYSF